MNTTATGVLAELRYLLRVANFRSDDEERMEDVIPKIEAIVEACKPFDRAELFFDETAYQQVLVEVTVSDLRRLQIALKALEQ